MYTAVYEPDLTATQHDTWARSRLNKSSNCLKLANIAESDGLKGVAAYHRRNAKMWSELATSTFHSAWFIRTLRDN